MKGKYLFLLILPLLVFTALLLSPLGVGAQEIDDHKIDICHATSSFSNPYTTNNVDKNSTVGGHGDHEGQLWYEGITTKDWGDIIPPFDYVECPSESNLYTKEYCEINDYCDHGNKCAEPIKGTYLGLNWPEGQEIWENDCRATDYEDCDEEFAIDGLWTEWLPYHEETLYRQMTITYVDYYNHEIFCREEVVKEYKPVDYEICTEEIEVEGSWTDWMDYDEETLYRELVTKYYDYYDQDYLCREETEQEFKEVETPEDPETPVEEDTPDVLGESDEVTTEVEEVGVVLAETGATSNILVYVIQVILTLSTILSGIFFSKKYIM